MSMEIILAAVIVGGTGLLLGLFLGLAGKKFAVEIDEKELKRVEAVIQSMTKKERRDPSIINGSRRKRVALGSGAKVQDVNRLLKQFAEARKMMKRFQEMQKPGKKGGFKLPFMR